MENCLFTQLKGTVNNDDLDFFEKFVMRFEPIDADKLVTIKGDSVMFNTSCVADNHDIPANTVTNKRVTKLYSNEGLSNVKLTADISNNKEYHILIIDSLRPYIKDVEKIFKIVRNAKTLDICFNRFHETSGEINIDSSDLNGLNIRLLAFHANADDINVKYRVKGEPAIITSTNMIGGSHWNSAIDNVILDLDNVNPGMKFSSFWANVQGNVENLPYGQTSLRTYPYSDTSLTGDIANLVSNWRTIRGLETSGSKRVGNLWISKNITVNGTPLQTYLSDHELDPTAVLTITWDESSFSITA